MDPATVAAFYQAKGYTVREGARVPGLSGNEHKVPLLAEGPLGSLAIFFGDFGGVDGPEMGGARKAARDIGATPVLAADEFSNGDRQVAARLGVVLLDGTMMREDEPAPRSANAAAAADGAPWPSLQVRAPIGGATTATARDEPDQHPWPASGRVGGRDGPGTRAVDIDDLLAETHRSREPLEPEPVPSPMPEQPAEAPAPPMGADDEAETLWRKPRARPAAAVAPGAAGSRQRFGWLSDDAPKGKAAAAPAGKALPRGKAGQSGNGAGGFAVAYDDVVPSRGPRGEPVPPDAVGEPAPVRLGDEPELTPTMEDLERRQRRDRLQRRIFWALFTFVVLYMLWAFWNGKIGN